MHTNRDHEQRELDLRSAEEEEEGREDPKVDERENKGANEA